VLTCTKESEAQINQLTCTKESEAQINQSASING